MLKNIAYKNSTCLAVATAVRKQLKKTADYEVGEVLVCRKRHKGINQKVKFTMYVNYEYEIVAVDETELTLKACGSDSTFNVKINIIKNTCTYDYCRTCHSFQGASIDGNMCIFDCDFHFVNRYWLWTAITRAKELDCIYFFMKDAKDTSNEKQEEETRLVKSYLKNKIKGYIAQDIKAKRLDDPERLYVSADWLYNHFGHCCSSCGVTFSYDIINGNVTSNLTANRIDNTEAHYNNNVEPLCQACNCALSDK